MPVARDVPSTSVTVPSVFRSRRFPLASDENATTPLPGAAICLKADHGDIAPQPMTLPSAFRANDELNAAVMATTPLRPAGTVVCRVELLPQATTVPSDLRASV